MKNEQQMLEDAFLGIPEITLTCHDIDKMEDEWIEQQRRVATMDEALRATRTSNRKTPHEI